jgi:repressor LexA
MLTYTPRQMDVLKFIKEYRDRHTYSPTMQEIGDFLHLSKVTVFEHVEALERKGLLRREGKHKARSLLVSDSVTFPRQAKATRIPLAGRIAAGLPVEAIEDTETLDLEEIFARPLDTFCLRVKGESMIDEQIRDGDFVVCERRDDPRNGETVVALLEDGEATLKKFYREKDRVRLQPANPAFEPIFVPADKIQIQGVVIGVIRKM